MSIIGTISAQAQTSCSCSVAGVCSTSLTCSSGYQAICTCQATGCTQECRKINEEPILERADNNTIIRAIKEAGSNNISQVLSKALGKRIVFEPTAKNFSFDLAESKSNAGSYWDILEFLSDKGNLTINNYKLEFWKGIRDSLLNGSESNICFDSASVKMILSHISFMSGKRYAIIDGDPNNKVSGPLQGNLDELIGKLSKSGNVIIVEK